MKRCDCPPTLEPRAVYQALKPLYLGDAVPPQIYVSDYNDGEIPDWRIRYRERQGASVLLIAFDHSNAYWPGGQPATQLCLFDDEVRYPAVRILSSPRKTLRSAVVEFSGLDGWPSQMCDMLQQAKAALKAATKEVAG